MNKGFSLSRPNLLSGSEESIVEASDLHQNPSIGVFRFSRADGAISFINSRCLDLLDIDRHNKPISLGDLFKRNRIISSGLTGHQYEGNEEIEFLHSGGGQDKWLSLTCHALPGRDHAEGLLIDITKKKIKELGLQAMHTEIDLFIYHASHRLRSPLATLLGLINLVKIDPDPEKDLPHYYHLIEEQAHRLNNLFAELMHIYTNNHEAVQPEHIDFHTLLDEVLSDLPVDQQDVDIHVQITSTSDFHSDRMRLKLIIRNLLSNALKFQKNSSAEKWVSVRIETTSREAFFCIEDNGIGMDDKVKQNIFNLFFIGTEMAGHGFGVGMYLVKNITDSLGGSIEMKSQPEQGAKFIIRIPDKKIEKKQDS